MIKKNKVSLWLGFYENADDFKNYIKIIEQVLDNKKTYFLIHGDYDDSGVFWVDEWYVLSLEW